MNRHRQGFSGSVNFRGDNRLKFTRDEQQAIESAELAMGYRSQPRIIVRPARRRRGLATVIGLLAAYFLLSGLIISVVSHVTRTQESGTEPEVHTAASAQPDTRLGLVVNSEASNSPENIGDSVAILVHRADPVYPPLAKQLQMNGRVGIRVVISTDGSAQSLEVVDGDPLFIMSAEEAVMQSKYKPAYSNGQAVESEMYINVVYTLQGEAPDPSSAGRIDLPSRVANEHGRVVFCNQ